MVEAELRRALVRAGRELHRRDMAPGAAGNLSSRLAPGRYLITPSGAAKGRLRPADLLIVDAAGCLVDGAGCPTSETPLHMAVYGRFAHVGAVVHAHPPAATALAIAHRPLADIAGAMKFGVAWDAATSTISIDKGH